CQHRPLSPSSAPPGEGVHGSSMAKYEEMLKACTPTDTVHEKIMLEGQDNASIDRLCGNNTTNRPVRAGVGRAADPKMDPPPTLSKYTAMVQAGIPEGAVRQKMGLEGISPAAVDAFFAAATAGPEQRTTLPLSSSRSGGSSGSSAGLLPVPPPPPLPPLRKQHSMGSLLGIPPPPPLPSPASRTGRGQGLDSLQGSPHGGPSHGRTNNDHGCPRVEGLPDTPSRRTSKPLLNLHWEVLPPASIDHTIWARANSSSVNDAEDSEVMELEKLFFKHALPATPQTPGGQGRKGR
ncbi:unnamed protein product, partial [Discosporangium mesarthrocarpum]